MDKKQDEYFECLTHCNEGEQDESCTEVCTPALTDNEEGPSVKVDQGEVYKVYANPRNRIEYPCYKYYNEPKEWHTNANVFVSCTRDNNGKMAHVDIKLYEIDSNNMHSIYIHNEDGQLKCRVTEQVQVEE